MVGLAELLGDTDFPTGFPPVHAFLWRKGLMTDLGSFGGRVSQAISVNERGEVVEYLPKIPSVSGFFMSVGKAAKVGRPYAIFHWFGGSIESST